MPKTTKFSCIAVCSAIAIGSIDLLLQHIGITKQDSPSGSAVPFIAGAIFTGILLVFIIYRHNWARWVYVILTGLSLFMVFPVLAKEIGSDPFGAISTLLQTALYISSIVLMFSKTTREWFSNKITTKINA